MMIQKDEIHQQHIFVSCVKTSFFWKMKMRGMYDVHILGQTGYFRDRQKRISGLKTS